MSTPADELRTAAEKIRNLSSATTEAPWLRWRDQEHIPGWDGFLMIGDSTEPNKDDDGDPVAKVYAESDAAYIAAMHPGVGAALADWLDHHAAMSDRLHSLVDGVPDGSEHPALAVARQINAQP